MKKYHR